MNLGMWVRLAMKRHLALVVDYDAVISGDADGSISEALDSIVDCDVHVVVLVPAGARVDHLHELDVSWFYLDDEADVTWGMLRDHVDADAIIALADPDHYPHLFAASETREVSIAVRGQAEARGWLSGALSIREFVRWLIAMRTGWMVRAPRFDVGWA